MTQAIFIWWLTAQAFGLVGLPLARFCFRALPDRGYAFAKSLGLLLSGYLAWLLAMLGLAPFGRALIVICALVVGGAGLLLRQGPRDQAAEARGRGQTPSKATGDEKAVQTRAPKPQFSMRNLGPALPRDWRLILAYEALFLAALLFLAFLRSYDLGFTGPNPWGTERPMDYALFNAIRNSSLFPPHDPWLSGYSINYYYFGYLLMAAVSLVSGVEQALAYNLALALIFALTALGVAGIVVNLILLTREDARRKARSRTPAAGKPSAQRRWTAVAGRAGAALLAVVLVLFAANQNGALQVIVGDNRVVVLNGPQLASALLQAAQGKPEIVLPEAVNTSDFGSFSTLERGDRVKDFNWWWPSRSVWDSYPTSSDPSQPRELRYTITEFPFFSFWLGDMHPHVMALPFGLLALALALQTLARPAAPAFAMGRRGWADLLCTGVILGSLYTINSWDFPTYVLLFLGALLLLYVRLGARNRSEPASAAQSPLAGVWWRHYATQAMMALLASWLLFIPFYLTFRSLVGGREPLINLPILATLTRTIGFVTWSRTPLASFLVIFGLMLTPLLAFVVVQGRRLELSPQEQSDMLAEPAGARWGKGVPLHFAARLPLAAAPWRYAPLALLAALLLGLLIGFPLLALLPLAAYAIWLALEQADHVAVAFTLWAFALVCLICFGTELIYIRDVFDTRMNTIFKFYYQAWLIWSVLAGYALWWLFAERATSPPGRRSALVARSALAAVAALFVVLLAGALVYPWLTIGQALREGSWVGLAGATKREQTPDDAAGIAWLRANAPRDAVVLEAAGGGYDTSGLGFGQVSAATGLPAVLGWTDHEEQWRGADPSMHALLTEREADVKAIYSAGDIEQARALLRKYSVRYIYIGAAERSAYDQLDINKLRQLGAAVVDNPAVTVIQVAAS